MSPSSSLSNVKTQRVQVSTRPQPSSSTVPDRPYAMQFAHLEMRREVVDDERIVFWLMIADALR
jgi:hypothetical protein